MKTNRKSLLGSVMAGSVGLALLCGAGAAMAQNYGYDEYSGRTYSDDRAASQPQNYQQPYVYTTQPRSYDAATPYGVSETVIVRPDFDRIQTQRLIGHYDGEVNPTLESISHPVSYSDLNLSRGADRAELRFRIRDTAENLCATLEDRDPGLRNTDDHRECVRDAVNDAMDQVGG